jgi:hypothetical protein
MFYMVAGKNVKKIKSDNLVKTYNFGWLSKKLHMRGAQNIYHFGVPEYVVMIDILLQRRR